MQRIVLRVSRLHYQNTLSLREGGLRNSPPFHIASAYFIFPAIYSFLANHHNHSWSNYLSSSRLSIIRSSPATWRETPATDSIPLADILNLQHACVYLLVPSASDPCRPNSLAFRTRLWPDFLAGPQSKYSSHVPLCCDGEWTPFPRKWFRVRRWTTEVSNVLFPRFILGRWYSFRVFHLLCTRKPTLHIHSPLTPTILIIPNSTPTPTKRPH